MPEVILSDYFYGDESEQFSYYRLPRLLVTGQRFKNLSTDVFQYENKICVQFVMSDIEIFHVRIHTGDLQPSGILFFNNIETARLAMEKAGAV